MKGFFWRVQCLACNWSTQSIKSEVEKAQKAHALTCTGVAKPSECECDPCDSLDCSCRQTRCDFCKEKE